ncbi:MAG: hypothetical protein KC503_20040 [Myxococcales bacterium]|nr:hypothetical protein [Myxococcales bacterium]
MSRIASVALLVALVAAACGDAFSNNDGASGRDGAADAASEGQLDARPVDAPIPVTVSGKVYAPEGTIPIFGALVYAVVSDPAPIPDKVFCDRCVELPQGTPNTRSSHDGAFELKLTPGTWKLVTQKGAFRRVREIVVPPAGLAVDPAITTLPQKTDATKGDTIPKMVVIQGAWDAIESSLAKLGLGQVDANGSLVAGSETFTLYRCTLTQLLPPVVDCKPRPPQDMLKDYALLSQYQILFLPCDSEWLDGVIADPTVKANLLRWIREGGRLYATDYQYDQIRTLLPDYITWQGQSGVAGSAELDSAYDAPAVVNDPDMKQWLAAQGVTTFDLQQSWTIIDSVHKVPTPSFDGKTYDVTPTVWVSGAVPGVGVKPATVSFPYGCGRVLFSSYHTEGAKSQGKSLLPQEKALLYVTLEVAVCLTLPKVN